MVHHVTTRFVRWYIHPLCARGTPIVGRSVVRWRMRIGDVDVDNSREVDRMSVGDMSRRRFVQSNYIGKDVDEGVLIRGVEPLQDEYLSNKECVRATRAVAVGWCLYNKRGCK